MLAWMVYATLAAAALGVTAWLIDFAAAGRFRRRVVWAGVFLASAAGPIVFSASRGIPSTVVAEADARATRAASGWSQGPLASDRMLGSAWLAVSAVIALWLIANQRRLRRRLNGYPSRIVDGERVLVSSDFGPAVVGVVRPQIVLPEWALAISESDRRIIVAHETEHRQAHDPLLAALALIAVAALPWNAALWWQLRRLRLAIEIDCDQRVVSRHGHDAHAYGMLLLVTRERTSRVTPAPALAMAAMRSGLGRRVEALVGGRPRSAVRRLSAVAAAVVLVAGTAAAPTPRLPMARAAVVVASAEAPPPAGSITPAAPPGLRQASAPSDASTGRPPRSAAVPPTLPRRQLTMARFDSSLAQIAGPMTPAAEARPGPGGTESREGRGNERSGPASTVEGRQGTASAAASLRIVHNASGTRAILLPIRDSLRPPPP